MFFVIYHNILDIFKVFVINKLTILTRIKTCSSPRQRCLLFIYQRTYRKKYTKTISKLQKPNNLSEVRQYAFKYYWTGKCLQINPSDNIYQSLMEEKHYYTIYVHLPIPHFTYQYFRHKCNIIGMKRFFFQI